MTNLPIENLYWMEIVAWLPFLCKIVFSCNCFGQKEYFIGLLKKSGNMRKVVSIGCVGACMKREKIWSLIK